MCVPSGCSWLQVEVWDRQQVAKQNESGYPSSREPRADPLLLLARGQQPTVSSACYEVFKRAHTSVERLRQMLLINWRSFSAGVRRTLPLRQWPDNTV